MTEQQSSYRQVIKATSLFGGVQFFNIIIQVIRSKAVALLLGPAGMGVMALLNATIGLIGSLTNFGLGISAVKDVASANNTGNSVLVSKTITVFRRLVIITGLLGTLITLILSPWLSQLTFGNKDYTVAFIWISITLLFTQLTSGQLVVLQGLRKLNQLAKASMLGSLLGLIATLPLYYFLGLRGIVPSMIATTFITLLLSWLFSRNVIIESIKITPKQTFREGKNMLQMGFLISLSGLLTLGASYIVSIYIRGIGGVSEVGLYNAGFAIINTYVGLVFNAMSTDYYPRLSIVANDNLKCKRTINQQAEIAILILAPILMIFLIFINWVVILLYSKQFVAINGMIYWAALGMFFKAVSWSIAFIFLAKGASKLFFWNELITNVYLLGLNILGYKFWGLTGLGLSFALAYLIYLLQVYIISNKKFEFSFDKNLIKIFVIQFLIAIVGFIIIKFMIQPFSYIVGCLLIVASSWYSFTELDKRIDIKKILVNFRSKI